MASFKPSQNFLTLGQELCGESDAAAPFFFFSPLQISVRKKDGDDDEEGVKKLKVVFGAINDQWSRNDETDWSGVIAPVLGFILGMFSTIFGYDPIIMAESDLKLFNWWTENYT